MRRRRRERAQGKTERDGGYESCVARSEREHLSCPPCHDVRPCMSTRDRHTLEKQWMCHGVLVGRWRSRYYLLSRDQSVSHLRARDARHGPFRVKAARPGARSQAVLERLLRPRSRAASRPSPRSPRPERVRRCARVASGRSASTASSSTAGHTVAGLRRKEPGLRRLRRSPGRRRQGARHVIAYRERRRSTWPCSAPRANGAPRRGRAGHPCWASPSGSSDFRGGAT